MKYDVTIGMPVFRSEAYIRQALCSALAQTYPSVEFLVVDDGSDDGSMAVIRDLQQQHPRGADIRILTHTANQGVAAARNHIIEAAQGDFLYFMDSDDQIAAETIALLMQNVKTYDAEIAFGSYEKIELTGARVVCQYPTLHLLGADQLACFAFRKYGAVQASACNYLVQTALLRKRGLRFIDTDYWEDMAFTFQLVTCVSRAVLLPDITYTYYCRAHSLSQYLERPTIAKREILRNARTVDHLKTYVQTLSHKFYFPDCCLYLVMTSFYMVCHVLKRRATIVPVVSDEELRAMMAHPATLRQISSFGQSRLRNLVLLVVGQLPAPLCVTAIRLLGKLKKLI